jgi:hypothetical protein
MCHISAILNYSNAKGRKIMKSEYSTVRSKQILIASLMMSLLVGCAANVKMGAHYDDIIDQSVHQIEANTTAHIKLVVDTKGAGDGSFERSRQFFADAKGQIQALIVRAETLEQGLKTTPLTNNFEVLQLQYDDLANLEQKPFDESALVKAQGAFDKSFRTIVKLIIDMKWNQETLKDK